MGFLTEKKSGTCKRGNLVGWPPRVRRGSHVVPTGFHVDPDTETVKIGGHAYRGQDRLYVRRRSLRPSHAAAQTIRQLIRTKARNRATKGGFDGFQ